jgi:hypothetical protein
LGTIIRTVRSAVPYRRDLRHVLFMDTGLCTGTKLASLPRLQAACRGVCQCAHCAGSRHHGRRLWRIPHARTSNGVLLCCKPYFCVTQRRYHYIPSRPSLTTTTTATRPQSSARSSPPSYPASAPPLLAGGGPFGSGSSTQACP